MTICNIKSIRNLVLSCVLGVFSHAAIAGDAGDGDIFYRRDRQRGLEEDRIMEVEGVPFAQHRQDCRAYEQTLEAARRRFPRLTDVVQQMTANPLEVGIGRILGERFAQSVESGERLRCIGALAALGANEDPKVRSVASLALSTLAHGRAAREEDLQAIGNAVDTMRGVSDYLVRSDVLRCARGLARRITDPERKQHFEEVVRELGKPQAP